MMPFSKRWKAVRALGYALMGAGAVVGLGFAVPNPSGNYHHLTTWFISSGILITLATIYVEVRSGGYRER